MTWDARAAGGRGCYVRPQPTRSRKGGRREIVVRCSYVRLSHTWPPLPQPISSSSYPCATCEHTLTYFTPISCCRSRPFVHRGSKPIGSRVLPACPADPLLPYAEESTGPRRAKCRCRPARAALSWTKGAWASRSVWFVRRAAEWMNCVQAWQNQFGYSWQKPLLSPFILSPFLKVSVSSRACSSTVTF